MPDFQIGEWPDAGRVEIISGRDPVSLQASAARRTSLKADLGAAVAANTVGVFVGDVEVTITWYVSQEVRYGTHMVADIDNLVKPLLDAVTGPDGVMIDDNQVQSLRIHWEDPYNQSVKFRIDLESLSPDEYLPREGLFFVEFSPDHCFPIFIMQESDLALPEIVQYLHELIRMRQVLIDHVGGDGNWPGRYFQPIQRFFPRARLGRYPVRLSTDFLLHGRLADLQSHNRPICVLLTSLIPA